MKLPACPRVWEAEAVEDGRLGESERLSFQRHAESCSECRGAVDGMSQLRELMSQIPLPTNSDFERRRDRALLLEQADRILVRSEGRRFRRLPAALVLATAVVLAAGVAATIRSEFRLPVRASNDVSAPRYEVIGLQDASWTRHESGGVARVRLNRGSAEFHVYHLEGGQRFLVDLPDGEIEVRGTRFVVSVGQETTRYVVVTEGKVVFRRRELSGKTSTNNPLASEQSLVAGDRWDRATESEDVGHGGPAHAVEASAVPKKFASVRRPQSPSKTHLQSSPRIYSDRGSTQVSGSGVTASVGTQSNPTTLALLGSSRSDSVSRAAGPRQGGSSAALPVVREPTARTEVSAAPTGPLADTAFSDGVIAFRSGRYAEADRVLQTFLAGHPNDPRAEDAAFLRAAARSRMGDKRGAAVLAREYLRRFSAGLRRPEAESLSARSP